VFLSLTGRGTEAETDPQVDQSTEEEAS
jgi:hypothetical protein